MRVLALRPRRRVMSVGFVSRVTTWLRRRPNAILIDSKEEFGVVVVCVCVVEDKLLLEVFDDEGGG